MPDTQADLSIRDSGGIQVIEFKTRKILEEAQIQQIGERLYELADAGPEPRILLDFSSVEHLSSAALSVLINLGRKVAQRGGQLILAGLEPQIYEVFRITRLNKLFSIQKTVDEGLKAFG